jgi:hypothetical protein
MKTFKFLKGHTGGVLVNAGVRTIRVQWTPELAQDINTYHGNDVVDEMTRLLSQQLTEEIDREIFDSILPMATRVASQTVGLDLVSVQPLTSPVGQIFYMDYKTNKFTFKFFRG